MLDEQLYQSRIIDLILQFQIHYQDYFSRVILNSFTKNTMQEKKLAIQRFSKFWRLTGD